MARVIILNGVSSVGKTTLAKAVQAQSEGDMLRLSMDDFISMVPLGREQAPDWFPVTVTRDGEDLLTDIRSGTEGKRLIAAMREFGGVLADQQLDFVIDDVCTKAELDHWLDNLRSHEVMLVKVEAPLEVIVAREKSRGDRMIGLARCQARTLHEGIEYDLVIDTSALGPSEAAQSILCLLDERSRDV